jgi:hypothetical protein
MIPWPVIGSGSGWAAFIVTAILIVRAVIKGDLVPRSTHEREVTKAEHDANEWRAEGRIKDQAIIQTLEPIKATTEQTGKTLHFFLQELQRVIRLEPEKEAND